MTDAINNHGRIKTTVPGGSAAPSKGGGKTVTTTGKPSAAASDVLNLSSERLMEQMARIPQVDQSRIETIKSALANGEYQPDQEVIARKFTDIEKLLP